MKRRPATRRALVPRCGWCDQELEDTAGGRRYCSHAHRQAAYLARQKAGDGGSEVDSLRARVRSLEDDRRLLEAQLAAQVERATDAHEGAEQYARMWEASVESNGRLVEALADSEAAADEWRGWAQEGPQKAYWRGYESGYAAGMGCDDYGRALTGQELADRHPDRARPADL